MIGRRAGRHRRAQRREPRRTVEMVDARTGQAHQLTHDAVAAAGAASDCYLALCGTAVLPAALVTPPRSQCRTCAGIAEPNATKVNGRGTIQA